MNPKAIETVQAEATHCRQVLDRVEHRLALLATVEPLTLAKAAQQIARLNLELLKLLGKEKWGTFKEASKT